MDDPHFEVTSMSMDAFVQHKTDLFHRCILACWRSSSILSAAQLQYAYHNYKHKCYSEAGGGLQCSKQHAHEREVISDFNNPNKRSFRLVARGIRRARRGAGEYARTLWRQTEVQAEIRTRVNQLVVEPRYSNICPCGKRKPSSLSMIKLDASHFFPKKCFR